MPPDIIISEWQQDYKTLCETMIYYESFSFDKLIDKIKRKHPIKYPLIYSSLTLAFIISVQRFQTLPVIVRVLLEYY